MVKLASDTIGLHLFARSVSIERCLIWYWVSTIFEYPGAQRASIYGERSKMRDYFTVIAIPDLWCAIGQKTPSPL